MTTTLIFSSIFTSCCRDIIVWGQMFSCVLKGKYRLCTFWKIYKITFFCCCVLFLTINRNLECKYDNINNNVLQQCVNIWPLEVRETKIINHVCYVTFDQLISSSHAWAQNWFRRLVRSTLISSWFLHFKMFVVLNHLA